MTEAQIDRIIEFRVRQAEKKMRENWLENWIRAAWRRAHGPYRFIATNGNTTIAEM